jgi:RNA polymerase primary sigma factor
MDDYKQITLAALVAQLKRGPKRLRLRQLLGIEFLLTVVEREKSYPYDFVCHAITGYRPPASPANSRLLDGESLICDLTLAAEDLSDNAGIALESWPEPVHSVAAVARRFDVSTKTIFRWRRRGLTGWKFRGEDQRVRILFPDRCVRRFVAQHAGLVTRGGSFSQLSPEERQGIVWRAGELVRDGLQTVNAVARSIAGETGRAVETIRLILKSYDEAHPRSGIFNRSPLQVEADDKRLAVWEAYVDGASVQQLARRFDKPVSWVYAAITGMRARDLKASRIEFVPSPEFASAEADEAILHPRPDGPLYQEQTSAPQRVPVGLPPYLASLFRYPLLTREGERILFRRMNYLKYKAHKLVEGLDPEEVSARDIDRIELLLESAARVKNEIVQANLRLVVSVAKRHLNSGQDLFEIISDGNISLMRAVDKFDYTRGFKFSTYATWAIMKNFARSIPDQRRHHDRYQTGWDELLESFGAYEPEETESDQMSAVRGTVDRMLATLDRREQDILRQRFGLDDHGQPQTLEQIGRSFGVSKERVRQLQARAMTKLRSEFEVDVQRLLGA